MPRQRSDSTRPQGRRSLSSALLRRWRLIVPLVLLVSLLVYLGWSWLSSLVPSTYSVTEMGRADYGGGPAGHDHGTGRPVAELTGPTTGEPDVTVDLAAREGSSPAWPAARRSQGYTLNGTSPGPVIEARQGDLVEVTLTNVDVAEGVTLHWHGVDVPNAEDGVAGVTQDAVQPGRRVRLPVRGRGRRNVLVPLPPGVPRTGARRAVRHARRPPRDGRAPATSPCRTCSPRSTTTPVDGPSRAAPG